MLKIIKKKKKVGNGFIEFFRNSNCVTLEEMISYSILILGIDSIEHDRVNTR